MLKSTNMGYILIEESLYRRLMCQILLDEDIMESRFSEQDYWMNGKEACRYLNISQAMLNKYRNSNMIGYCKMRDTYSYKRADVYRLKAQMDAELVEAGKTLKIEHVIETEKQAIRLFEEDEFNIHFMDDE